MFTSLSVFLRNGCFGLSFASLAGVLLLCSCGSGSQVPVALEVSTQVASTSASGVDGAIVEGINSYRSQRGLARQSRHAGLDRMARSQAAKMAREGKFEHSNMEYAEEVAKHRHRLFNVEENILRASGLSVEQVPAVTIQGWIQSRGHRITLESKNSHLGVGVVQAADGTFFACAVTASPIKRTMQAERLSRSYGVREGEFQGIDW